MSDLPAANVIDRSGRTGSVGLVLLLAGFLVAAAIGVLFIASEQTQTFIIGLLALLSVAGVFALFAGAVGLLRIAGKAPRNDLTKAIADTAGDALVAVDRDGRVIYANEAYIDLASTEPGRPGAPADVKPVERLFTGSSEVSEAIYRLAQAAREQRRAQEDIRVPVTLGAMGSPPAGAWYRLRVRAVTPDGGTGVTLWSVADITRDRERQENVFQELQQAIDYLDHAPAGFLSVTPNGAVDYMNATLAHWLDHDLAQIGAGGVSIGDIVAGSAASLLSRGPGAAGEVRTEVIDLDFRTRTGRALPVRLLHRIAFGHDGKPGSSRTLALDRGPGGGGADALRAAEVRFARFFNSTPFAIATLDAEGRVLLSNAFFARLFGPARGAEGDGRALTSMVISTDQASLRGALTAAAGGRASDRPIDVTLTGEPARSAQLFLAPASDGDGEAAIVYALDTTDRIGLENQLRQAQKMQAIGELAGGVAHDFNNVLQAIMGYADLLLQNHRPTDPAFQDIIQIKQNANRAKNLVQHLLAFSRRQTLRPQMLQLGETIAEVTTLLKRMVGDTVTLDVRHGRDLWDVYADGTQFEQALLNLAVNARDAMGAKGKLSIRTQNVTEAESRAIQRDGFTPGDYVLVEVDDTGSGIAPDLLEKIFEPFFTTKEVGKGTGLGLSMVYGFVKQTGGFVFCDSTVGKGTTFRIYLPRHVGPPPVPELPIVAPLPSATSLAAMVSADHTGTGVILLVEDEEAVRAFGARALSSRGYEVLQAASGREALDVVAQAGARGQRIDLVVSDVVMPEMDGPTLLRELRQQGITTKFVFVSGYAEEAFSRNLPDGEEFGFLAKPFGLKQLIEMVKLQVG